MALYAIKVNNSLHIGKAHFISYNPPKLRLRLSAKNIESIVPLYDHSRLGTKLKFELESWEPRLEIFPAFQAQVTYADELNPEFELTVLTPVDLSGLE